MFFSSLFIIYFYSYLVGPEHDDAWEKLFSCGLEFGKIFLLAYFILFSSVAFCPYENVFTIWQYMHTHTYTIVHYIYIYSYLHYSIVVLLLCCFYISHVQNSREKNIMYTIYPSPRFSNCVHFAIFVFYWGIQYCIINFMAFQPGYFSAPSMKTMKDASPHNLDAINASEKLHWCSVIF